MKWKLQSEANNIRIYENDTNSSTIQTNLIYTDKLDNRWFGFADLLNIPSLRIAYSKTISDLFKIGLSPQDLKTWNKKEKEILTTVRNDPKKEPEAYEKLYSLLLEREAAIENIVEPLKQHLALCTIYVLGESEVIDRWSYQSATAKLDIWKLDEDAQAFFLSWHTTHIVGYGNTLDKLSQIALTNPVNGKTTE